MQVCTSLQTNNHASTPLLSFLQAGCPSCRPTNSVKALKVLCNGEEKTQHSLGLWKASSGRYQHMTGHVGQERNPPPKKKLATSKNRGMVTVCQVKRWVKLSQEFLKAYWICRAAKPHTTLRNLVVHPKVKPVAEEKFETVYRIQCTNYELWLCFLSEKLEDHLRHQQKRPQRSRGYYRSSYQGRKDKSSKHLQ